MLPQEAQATFEAGEDTKALSPDRRGGCTRAHCRGRRPHPSPRSETGHGRVSASAWSPQTPGGRRALCAPFHEAPESGRRRARRHRAGAPVVFTLNPFNASQRDEGCDAEAGGREPTNNSSCY